MNNNSANKLNVEITDIYYIPQVGNSYGWAEMATHCNFSVNGERYTMSWYRGGGCFARSLHIYSIGHFKKEQLMSSSKLYGLDYATTKEDVMPCLMAIIKECY